VHVSDIGAARHLRHKGPMRWPWESVWGVCDTRRLPTKTTAVQRFCL